MKRIALLAAILGFLTLARSDHAANQATALGDQEKAVSEIKKLRGRVEVDATDPRRPVIRVCVVFRKPGQWYASGWPR